MSARIAYGAAAAISAAGCVIVAPGALAQDRGADDEPAVVMVPPVDRTDISLLPPPPPPPPPPEEQPATRATLISGTISNDDYPPEARSAGEQGVVVLRFSIGTDGRVFDCNIVRSSGSDILDTTSCNLVIERFRYRPARDADGEAMVQTQTRSIRWQIDRGEQSGPVAAQPVTGVAILTATLAPDGTKLSCEVKAPPALTTLFGDACNRRLLTPPGTALPTVPIQLQLAMSQSFDHEPAPMPELPSGFVVAMTTSGSLDLDETGRPTACRTTLVRPGHPERQISCNAAEAPYRFVAADGESLPHSVQIILRVSSSPALVIKPGDAP